MPESRSGRGKQAPGRLSKPDSILGVLTKRIIGYWGLHWGRPSCETSHTSALKSELFAVRVNLTLAT